MIEAVHTYKIFIDSDKNEFATEEELKNESKSYAIDRCMSHVPRKRTFYSSNDNVIRDTLNKAKVEVYEEDQKQKRHEAYTKLKDMYGKWYKDTGNHGAYFVRPTGLAKYKSTCGGKKLMIEMCREIGWSTEGIRREIMLKDIVIFVDEVERGVFAEVKEDEIKKLIACGQKNIEEEYDKRIKTLYDRIADVQAEKEEKIDKIGKEIVYDKEDYIFYDNDGKMIE